MNINNGLDLDRIIFIGRTYEEYLSMFRLTQEEIRSLRILDCPGGACSFTAMANSQGGSVISADIAYGVSSEKLVQKGRQDIEHAIKQISKVQEHYVWNYFSDIEDLSKHRHEALETCTEDIRLHPECYIKTELPRLPFQDDEFDLVLSAHFLFMYSDRLTEEFQQATITEFMRVARQEIRVYPINQMNGDRSPLVEPLIDYVKQRGWKAEIISVPYEFQVGAVHMLSLTNENK